MKEIVIDSADTPPPNDPIANDSYLQTKPISPIPNFTPSPKSTLDFVDEDSEQKWDKFPEMSELLASNQLDLPRSGQHCLFDK